MKRVFRLFRIAGIPVRVDLSWFIVFILVAWTLADGYFTQVDNLSIGTRWVMGIISALFLFISVLLHELSHSLVGIHEKLPIRSITLFIFGGVADIGEEPQTPAVELKMALAGPAVSLILAILFFGVFVFGNMVRLPASILAVLNYLWIINLTLLIFNMVPGFPLDGGRVLRALLWFSTSLRKATRISAMIGSGFGIFLIGAGILLLVAGRGFVGGFWLLIIGFFLRNAADQSYKSVLFKEALEGIPVSQIMTENPITVDADFTIHQLVEEFFYRKRFHSFPVLDNGVPVGFVYIGEVKNIPREKWHDVRIRDVMDTGIMNLALSPDDDAVKALNAMLRSDKGRIPIIRNGDLVGLVSRQDIINYLNIRIDLE